MSKVLSVATKTTPAQTQDVFVRPLLTGICADYIMRCHITLSFGPAAVCPGFWCMCARKLQGEIVGGYVAAVAQPFLDGEEALSGDAALVLSNKQLVDMGAEAQQISNALAVSTANGRGALFHSGSERC